MEERVLLITLGLVVIPSISLLVPTFVATSSNGYVRLFDFRHPCPVLTFDAEHSGSTVYSSAYVHPDGIPTLFTCGVRTQNVSVLDIHARKLVYDLSTGNTEVNALVWDSKRSTLHAATECNFLANNGATHGYRDAEIPKFILDRDGDGDEDGSRHFAWPTRAFTMKGIMGRCMMLLSMDFLMPIQQ
ncbi:hypothetical protein ABKN59_010008 [Abortiporus biennis]